MKNKKCNQMLAILMAITMGCTSIPTTAFATELPAATTVSEEASTGEELGTEASTTAIEASTEEVTTSTEAVTEETTKQKSRSAAPAAVEPEEATTEEIPEAEETEDLVYDTSWYNAEDTEFTLTTAEQLVGLAQLIRDQVDNFEGKTIKMGNDINAGSVKWVPIGWRSQFAGTKSQPFEGTFDGQGHELTNVLVKNVASDPNECLGVFGYTGASSVVKNLHVTDTDVVATGKGSTYTASHAGIVGLLAGTISHCSFEGTVSSTAPRGNTLGGIAGSASELSSKIEYCTFEGNIENNSTATGSGNSMAYSGGIAGRYGKIYNCTVKEGSKITAKTGVAGGITADLTSYSAVKGCVNYGTVRITDKDSYGNYIGGIVATGYSTEPLEGNVNAGALIADRAATVGGIMAYSSSKKTSTAMNYCVNLGTIKTYESSTVYGIATDGEMNSCYSTFGLLAGDKINNCYTMKNDEAEKVKGVTYLAANAFKSGILLNGLNGGAPIWEKGEDGYPALKETAIFGISIHPEGISKTCAFSYDKEKKAYITSIPGVDFTSIGEEYFTVNCLSEDAKTSITAADSTGQKWTLEVTAGGKTASYSLLLEKSADISWYSEKAKDLYLNTASEVVGFNYLGTVEGKSFKDQTIHLNKDIDMAGTTWAAMGTYEKPFRGTFDGENHTLKNFTLSYEGSSSANIGMFAYTNGASIKNITFENFKGRMKASYGFISSIAYQMTTSTMENVHIKGINFELERVGTNSNTLGVAAGMVYRGIGVTFRNCSISGGEIPAAGMFNTISYITNSQTGKVTTSLVEGCVNKADAQGAGIVNSMTGEIKDCVNEGKITDGTASYVAGIAGSLNGTMKNCHNKGTVEGSKNFVSGVVGELLYNSGSKNQKIINCSNSGAVTSNSTSTSAAAAGVLAQSSAVYCELLGCFNSGAVTADKGNAVAVASTTNTSYEIALNACGNTGTVTGANGYTIAKGTKNTVTNSYSTAEGTLEAAAYKDVHVTAEGEKELPTGVKSFTSAALTDGTLAKELNTGSMIRWNQTKEGPVPSQASIYGGSVASDGYQGTYEFTWEKDAFHVTIPALELDKMTVKDLQVQTLAENAEVDYRYEGENKGKITVTSGEETQEYTLQFAVKEGTEWYNPAKEEYTLSTVNELKGLAVLVNDFGETMEGKTLRLGADLDFSDVTGWIGIGNNNVGFKGTFDGQGHSISNWKDTISSAFTANVWEEKSGTYLPTTYISAGLFGVVNGGTIKNLSLKKVDLTFNSEDGYSWGSYTHEEGAVVSYLYDGAIENVTVTGKVTSNGYVGGIVGRLSGTATGCTNEAEVTGGGRVGGIAEIMSTGKITDSINKGSISATTSSVTGVAGIVGRLQNRYSANFDAMAVENCTNEGTVTSSGNYAGGVIGYIDSLSKMPVVTECFNAGKIHAKNGVAGGVIGDSGTTLTMNFCGNTGAVEAANAAGGMLAGDQMAGYTFNFCYNNGIIKGGNTYVGGICGDDSFNCYNHCYSFYYDAEQKTFQDGTLHGTGGSDNVYVNAYYYAAQDKQTGAGLTRLEKTSDFTDGTLVKKMNAQWGAWKQGAIGPEVADSALSSIAVKIGKNTFAVTADEGKLKVQIPSTDLATLTKDNFSVVARKADTTLSYAYNEEKQCWTLTATNGAETSVYEIYFDFTETGWYDAAKDSYTISTVGELFGLQYLVNEEGITFEGKTIFLEKDLDMAGIAWDGIGVYDPSSSGGTITTSFQGTFDGKGHKITNLTGDTSLFRVVEQGTVKHLVLKDVALNITTTSSNYQGAAVVGYALESTLEDIQVSGTINSGRWYTAMIAGYAKDTLIKDCNGNGTVDTTNRYAAGILGGGNAVTVKDSSFIGTIKATGNMAGGISSYLTNCSVIEGCSTEGSVQAKSYVGGMVGRMDGLMSGTTVTQAVMKNDKSKMAVTSTNSNAGGIVGYAQYAGLTNCSNEGAVKSNSTIAGGMAGYLSGRGFSMAYCVNKGDITGVTAAAGLIGDIGSNGNAVNKGVEASYSTGELLATASNGVTSGINAKGTTSYMVKNTILVAGKLPAENEDVTYEKVYALKGVDAAAKKTAGITVCDAEAFVDGTVVAKLNSDVPAWVQGKELPELSQTALQKIHFTLAGVEKEYVAAIDAKDNTYRTFRVTLPIGTDTTKLTKDNIKVIPVNGQTKVEIEISKDGRTWTLTATNGTEKAVYQVLVEVPDKVDTPIITKNLTGGNYYSTKDVKKHRIHYMNVSAVVYDGGKLSYQWYVNNKNSNKGGTAIEGATKALYQPVLEKDGKPEYGRKWYYCVVTNTVENNGKAYQASQASNLREVNLQCTVTLVDDSDENNGVQYLTAGKTLASLTLKDKAGLDAQFYSDADKTKRLSLSTKVTEDTTLYLDYEDSQYTVTLPESTENYTVTPDDTSITKVLYGESYGFSVARTNDHEAQFFVKVNGKVVTPDEDGGNHYTISNIKEDQVVAVEYVEEVLPEADGTYKVANEAQLITLLTSEAGKTAKVTITEDIALAVGTLFFATEENAFEGTIDGQGHTLSNMTGPFIGWVAAKGEVKNLNFAGTFNTKGVVDCSKTSSVHTFSSRHGSKFLAPIAVNLGTVSNCISAAKVTYSGVIGGITAYNAGTVKSCGFTGTLNTSDSGQSTSLGSNTAGGITGVNNGVVSGCYCLGAVGRSYNGGIVGMNSVTVQNATVENCYVTGTITTQVVMNTPTYGAIIGSANPNKYATNQLDNVKNNYFLKTVAYGQAHDRKVADASVAATRSEKKMKDVALVGELNSNSTETLFLYDKDNKNNGYPILACQGTPKATKDNVTLSVTGRIQADEKVTAVVNTTLSSEYSIDWLAEKDGVYTLIESAETSITLNKKQIGSKLHIRYSNKEDGSVVTSESLGVIQASPIKSIAIDLSGVANSDGKIDLIYDASDETRGTTSFGISVVEPESAHLADGQKVVWESSDRSVLQVVNGYESVTYKHDVEVPGATMIKAMKAGTATLTATMDGMTATVTVVVRPAVVDNITVQKPDGENNTTTESGAMAGNLADTYGWDMGTNSKTYVTALHLFAKEMVDSGKFAKEDITVTNGVLVSVKGQNGTWYYTLNGEYMGAIDATREIKAGDQVRFIFVPTQSGSEETPVTKMAMFDKLLYNAFETVQTEITLTEANVNGEATQSPAAGAVITVTDNAGNPVKAIVKDGDKVESITTNATGKVKVSFETEGTYHIKATRDGMMEATADIVIAKKIKVAAITATPSKIDLKTGQTADIKATVKPDNATVKDVEYESADDDVATVDANGKVTANGPGTTVITVKSVDQPDVMATVKVTVTQPVKEIKVNATATVVAGNSIQLNPTVLPANASNKAVNYVSKTPGIATVDSNGKVLGVSEGTVTIEIVAKDGSGVKASVVVTVKAPVYKVTGITLNAKSASVKVKSTYQIKTKVAPDNATDKKVTYTSSKPAIATVDANGKVTAKKVGSTVITVKAQDGSGAAATMKVTVTAPKITLNAGKTTIPLQVKKSTTAIKIKTTDVKGEKIVKATSSKTSIASVAVKKGVLTIKAKKAGTVTITVQTTNGGKASVKVKVQKGKVATKKLSLNKTKVTLKVKGKHRIVVTRNPITATEKITYKTSNSKVAAVTSSGVITAKKAGKATITVKASNGKKATVTVTVKK